MDDPFQPVEDKEVGRGRMRWSRWTGFVTPTCP